MKREWKPTRERENMKEGNGERRITTTIIIRRRRRSRIIRRRKGKKTKEGLGKKWVLGDRREGPRVAKIESGPEMRMTM